MSNENVNGLQSQGQSEPSMMVCVVTCYGNIVGVYRNIDDAHQVQREMIMKNRPAECVVKPLN